MVPVLTPYGWVCVSNPGGKITPRKHIHNSKDFNSFKEVTSPSVRPSTALKLHYKSLESGLFNIPTSVDDLVGPAQDAWKSAEDSWHKTWGKVKGRLKVQLPKADKLGMQGKTPVGFKLVGIWGGTKIDKFVKAELYEATESAKRQAREAYNNLSSEVKSKVYSEWRQIVSVNSGDMWLPDTYEKFLKRIEELALEAYEAIQMMKNLLLQIRNIRNLTQPCPDGLHVRQIPIFRVDVPIIEKTYVLSFKVCYPLNLFPGDLVNDLIGHLQKKSEDKVEERVLYAVATTGFSGILAGLQMGINESLSYTPTWIEEWARNKADQTAQNAKNSVQLKIDFSEA